MNTHDECHKAHARATGGDHFVAVIVGDIAAFAGQAGGGVCEIPKLFDGLFLNRIHEDSILFKGGLIG